MELPNDVVMEILSRLPLAKLGKIRALSKYHAQASHEWFYKELAAKHGPIFLDGFVLQCLQYNGYKFHFASPIPQLFQFLPQFLPRKPPNDSSTVANGLVLVETSNPRHPRCHPRYPFYSICKPSTKQCKGIPLPRISYPTICMALFVLRSNPLHFKILCLSSDKLSSKHLYGYSYTICDFFDSETWRWKRLNDIVRDPTSGCLMSYSAPIFASGSAHWKIGNDKSILAFDFYSETWLTIPMPKAIVEERENMKKNYVIPKWHIKLIAYKGKLGLMRKFTTTDSTELWVMDNYFNRTWTKRNGLLKSTVPMAFYGSDVSVSMTLDEMTFSNLETNHCNSIKLDDRNYRSESGIDTFPYMTDFEQWDFHPPPRTINPRTLAKIIRKHSRPIIDYYSYF